MEANGNLSSASAAHPETMDVLSRAWCNFAVQTLNPELQPDQSLALIDTPIKDLDVTLTSDPFPVRKFKRTHFLFLFIFFTNREMEVINGVS